MTNQQNVYIPIAIILTGFIIAIGMVADKPETKETLKIIPEENTPTDYGIAISTANLERIASYDNLQLSDKEQARYDIIISDMVCKFCCGPAPVAQCGCQHAAGYRGLTKYLISNSNYSDKEIKNEVEVWRAFFFPQNYGLPEMRGGC